MFRRANEIETLNTQKSDIDVFSRLEVTFLEKFFRYNLNDYFSDALINVYEDVLQRKVSSKMEKAMSIPFFRSMDNFYVEEFEQRIDKFYRSKSKSIQDGDLPYALNLKYCNCTPTPSLVKEGELIFFDVKLKADVQKIEEFPQKIISSLESLKPSKKDRLTAF